MLEFFDAVAAFFSNIATWFMNFLESLKMLFTSIPAAIAWLQYVIAFIPAPVAVFSLLAISVSILFLVLGRNS